jgi:hypothetical protein
MDTFVVETSGASGLVPCDACGDKSRSVSGFVRGGGGETMYFVHWTDDKVEEHGAHLDLLMAQDPASIAVALEFRVTDEGPGFMVIDASQRQTWDGFPSPVRRLNRDEVVGTRLAGIVFSIVDAIWLQDSRIRELHGDAA